MHAEPPPRTLQYIEGTMVVLGVGASSYEQGTHLSHNLMETLIPHHLMNSAGSNLRWRSSLKRA